MWNKLGIGTGFENEEEGGREKACGSTPAQIF